MTTATEMTPAEFLESDLLHHPGFVGSGDPRLDARWEHPTLSLPNLAALIRRIGGIDALPDRWPEEAWVLKVGRDIVLELSRSDARTLVVEAWHPRCPALMLMFKLPDDWSGSPWYLSVVMGDDLFPTDADLERLAARALDHHVGEILDSRGGHFYVDGQPFVP
jgi:hypothetical protein